MRLVDADNLIETMTQDWFLDILLTQNGKKEIAARLVEMIDSVPLAYDTEEVVSQINNLFNFRADTQDMLQEIRRCGSMSALVRKDRVIEIVEGGGV